MSKTEKGVESVVYLDGEFVFETQAKVSVFDMGFHQGDSVHEATRTFNHKLFKLEEHIERLFCSLRCTRINPGLGPEEMKKIALEVLERNKHLLESNDDCWIFHKVSAGMHPNWRKKGVKYKDAFVTVHFTKLPFEQYASYYKTGVHAVVPWTRRVSPKSLDPKIKSGSRIELNVASREVKLMDPSGYCLLLDEEGNIAEGNGQNFFVVTKGVLQTSLSDNVLKGISRRFVMELAREMEIPLIERNMQPYDVYNADEAFFTTTSFCILPATKFNWVDIGKGIPGPITNRLLEAWSNKVGVDVVKQALSHLKTH